MRIDRPLDRRQFLTSSALAGTALSPTLLPHLSPQALAKTRVTPGSAMRLGLVTYLWAKDWDLPTIIKNCEKSKVLGIELRTTHKHGVEPSLNKTQRKEVKKRFADSPVECLGPGSNERYDNPNPTVLKKAIEKTKAFIKLSHDIGATGVKVKPDRFHKGVDKNKTIEQIGKSLKTLAEFGQGFGQEIRLEVHGQCSHLPTIHKIMQVADHPNAKVCWNSNNQDLQGKGLEYNFNLVKKYFGATAHIRELNIGKYPYQKLINLFVKMDYPGWILLEARTKPKDPIAALIEQRQIFHKMIKNTQA